MAFMTEERLLSLVVGAAAIVLVVLATLQYRWSRQMGEALASQIGISLKAAMLDWHLDLLREMSAPCMSVHPATPLSRGVWLHALEDYEHWTLESSHSQMVNDVFMLRRTGDRWEVFRFDLPHEKLERQRGAPPKLQKLTATLEQETVLPAATEAGRHEGGTALSGGPPPMMSGCAFDPASLALVRAVRTHVEEGRQPAPPVAWLVFDLDRKYLQRSMLPELAHRYFSGDAGLDYNLAVVRGNRGDEVIYSSDEPYERDKVTPPDARLDMFGAEPKQEDPDSGKGVAIADNPISAVTRAGWREFNAPLWFDMVDRRNPESDWYLLARHRDRSLQQIVSRTELRERALGLGILVLLATGMGIVAIAAQRAHKLARLHVDFVAAVSHELRTPVAVICSAADNLADGVAQGQQQLGQYRSIIVSQARQLTMLVEQILAFAGSGGKPAYDTSAVDVQTLVGLALDKVDGLLKSENFDVTQSIEPDLPAVTGDSVALSQCLQNLIVNAVKYSGDSRWLGVSARSYREKNRAEVLISIEDRGIGIAPADLESIFQPFFRSAAVTDGHIHGTGLGLSLAKNIAESIGGRLSVKSKLGEGSTFTLHLPVMTDRRTLSRMGQSESRKIEA